MNLKKRLMITNSVTVTIPLAITFIIAVAFIYISSDFFNMDVSYSSFKKLAETRAELFDTSAGIQALKPELLEEKEYQQYLVQKLSNINGQVVITKKGETIFTSLSINKIDIEKCLDAAKTSNFDKTVNLNGVKYFVEAVNVRNKDAQDENVILLSPTKEEIITAEKFILILIVVFIASFLGVNLFMSYLFTNRILKPVAQLKEAASQISGGNLDCEITEDGDEEIKELCRDFERMRVQLKDTIHEKMVYDENRKMLVSSISHDLKTPITSIKGYVEGILDGVANTPEKVEEYLRTVYSKAEQVDRMIDDLLLYSKLDLNQLPFNFERTNILDYFEYCIADSAHILNKSNIKINLINELKNSKEIILDRERMRRVIMNIIDNSRKYMNKSDGKIEIILRETPSSILAEIRDNGSGISKNDINKIFDRFYRANTARSGTDGSGLGLAIAKQIVEGHNGKIWAVSHESEGTSIIISLAKIQGESEGIT